MELREPRAIVLTTIYRSGVMSGKHFLVTSYKTNPRGEEHLASVVCTPQYNLKVTFVNRVIVYTDEVSHIPLINMRVMLNKAEETTVYSRELNPHPRTTDYLNPHERNANAPKDRQSRISLGSISCVNFAPGIDVAPSITGAVLAEICGAGDHIPLPRRSRRPPEREAHDANPASRPRSSSVAAPSAHEGT